MNKKTERQGARPVEENQHGDSLIGEKKRRVRQIIVIEKPNAKGIKNRRRDIKKLLDPRNRGEKGREGDGRINCQWPGGKECRYSASEGL